jgi:hypothetical protein
MQVALNYGFWEFWAPYGSQEGAVGPQKCVFDGENKLIYVNPDDSEISVKQDVYSAWKEWVSVRDNAKFLPAIRVTGGDPIAGTTSFTGDTYFLINGWRFLIDHSLNIDGVIYSDNFPSPFIQQAGTQIVTNKVSSLVQTVTTESIAGITVPSAAEIRQEMDTNSSKLISIDTKVQTLNNGPTVAQIRQEIDSSSTQLTAIKAKTDTITAAPSASDIADAVRTELTPELTHLLALQNGEGLNSTQATMLLEIYRLYGLDPTRPLVVTKTNRTAGGGINQSITTNDNQTTITRV